MFFAEWLDEQGHEKIARKLCVTETTVRNWKRGHCFPRVVEMKQIRKMSKGIITYEMIIDRKRG